MQLIITVRLHNTINQQLQQQVIFLSGLVVSAVVPVWQCRHLFSMCSGQFHLLII